MRTEGEIVADFVNYQHRSITLPPGCKDLADLLKPRPASTRFLNWADAAIAKSPYKPRKIEYKTGTLVDMLRCAEACFGGSPQCDALVVGVTGSRYAFALQAGGSAEVLVTLWTGDSSDAVRKVRAFAGENDLPPFVPGIGGGVSGDEDPPYLHYVCSSEPPVVLRITYKLAHEVYGLADDPAIRFFYW